MRIFPCQYYPYTLAFSQCQAKAKNLNDELSQSMHATFNKMVVPFSLILFQIILTLIIAVTCFGLHLFRSI